LIPCGGCPKAYHQSCLEASVADHVSACDGEWYCGEGCKSNFNNKKIGKNIYIYFKTFIVL